jgi:hypothetical protein
MVSREVGGASVAVVGASVAVDAVLSFMTFFIIHSAISIEDREDVR